MIDDKANETGVPQGYGISCRDCSKSTPMIDFVDVHQKHDDRLANIRLCLMKKNSMSPLRIKHDDLIHACDKFDHVDASKTLVKSLPSSVVRLQAEQKAQTPGNDFMSATAAANLFVMSIKSKKRTAHECRAAIEAEKKRSPVVGEMIASLFENQLAIQTIRNKKMAIPPSSSPYRR